MIDTGAGVVDADYRGIVFVLLYNLSDQDFTGMPSFSLTHIFRAHTWAVNEGDRIAQLILERIATPDVVEVQVWLPDYANSNNNSDLYSTSFVGSR